MKELDLIKLEKIIENAKNLVFLTGAGVSTLSSIPDFRSPTSVRSVQIRYALPVETILSHTFFFTHPDSFYDYYFNFMVHREAKANIVHQVLYKLSLNKNKKVSIITQNIDGLHESLSKENVYPLHGTIFSNHCIKCHSYYSLEDILKLKPLPRCPKCHNLIKPDVVLYEEPLDQNILDKALHATLKADTMIILGTSLRVYPASGLINYFKGTNLVIINKEKTPFDHLANLVIQDDLKDVFNYLFDSLNL